MLLRRALERGIAVADLENMTIGMVLDFLTEYNNEEIDARNKNKRGASTRAATQSDIDAW